jgi:peptidyl-prolyl cis-trans isomerase B (cyclophilin B)
VAVLKTSEGEITVRFFPDRAPVHVAMFKKLARRGFYNGTRFHRCIPDFMIQGGDPNTKQLEGGGRWGTGGYVEDGERVNLEAEFNKTLHTRGVLSMARSRDPDSASSQFFIMQKTAAHLDRNYTAFGIVLKGMDVLDKIIVTGDYQPNGSVPPDKAVVLESVTIKNWPGTD